ncbi:hypothetical protein B0H16DRAFT_1513999 [Mycena metata]|uniref:Uncharacterized protein n=1 Tax=Mycena metata TaxID=1033252 RepID=A0AAD7JTJ0_9AGAR|nr:hypothetical protein B0H16DRAFT_1513999 [Mycena metata]
MSALGGDHTHLCITLDDDVAPADQERLYATYPRSTEPVPLVRQEFIKHLVDVYTETLGGPVDTPTNPNDPNVQLIYGVLGMHLARNPHDSAAILEAAVKGFPGAGVHYPTYHTPPELISGLRLTAPDLAQGGGYHSQFNDTVRAIQLRMKLGDDDLVKHFQPGVKVDDRQSQIFWRSLAHDPSLRCRLQGTIVMESVWKPHDGDGDGDGEVDDD